MKSWEWEFEWHRPPCSLGFSVQLKLCLHERLLAYLSPDTVTGDDGKPDTETAVAEDVGASGTCPNVC